MSEPRGSDPQGRDEDGSPGVMRPVLAGAFAGIATLLFGIVALSVVMQGLGLEGPLSVRLAGAPEATAPGPTPEPNRPGSAPSAGPTTEPAATDRSGLVTADSRLGVTPVPLPAPSPRP